jgi:hypothetical protein
VDLAALIISILALTTAVASLSVQITLAVMQYKKDKEPKELNDLATPSAAELERFFTATPEKDKQKISDILENPDIGKFSGIDEEFNI